MPRQEHRIQFKATPEVEGGVYADFANLWHTKDVFTIDFSALASPASKEVDDETGDLVVTMQARVVARVRIPPEQVFELMKALEQQLTTWETETGRRPTANQPIQPTGMDVDQDQHGDPDDHDDH